jgi:hypothetical protein
VTRLAPVVAALTALAVAAAPAAAGESLAETLYDKADAVLQKLQTRQMTAVGVLKFTTEGKDADKLNELGTTLAVRTQMALVLKNKNPDFVVIENPNRQVVDAGMKVNHLDEKGRQAFFTRKYVPAFGEQKVAASGFVVGTGRLSDDRKTLALKLQVFDATGKLDDLTAEWKVDADPDLLGEAGDSHALNKEQREAVAKGKAVDKGVVQALAAKTAAEGVNAEPPAKAVKVVKGEPAALKAPVALNSALDTCPVKWVVRYNDQDQPVSGGLVPEPGEKDKVAFFLHNTSADETFGVVLLVNGENTLYKERQAVAKCRKWVLAPGDKALVTGFQTSADKSAEFEVVRPDSPKANGVRYSENLGLFRMVVFAGQITDKDPKPTDVQVFDEVQVVANARLNDRPDGVRPASLNQLKGKLTLEGMSMKTSRGVVVAGKEGDSKTEQVFFAPVSDQPVADITLRYFHPKK